MRICDLEFRDMYLHRNVTDNINNQNFSFGIDECIQIHLFTKESTSHLHHITEEQKN